MDKLTRIKVAGIPEGFQELSFTTNDVTLNYVVGPDNGPPLLLIPGQMESWQGYKCVLPVLSNRFHIFVPDLRGHGKSTRTPGRYSYNICGEDLKCFLQEVIQKPAVVAGLSSGAVLAIICEDPPIFSSIWPRIQEEKFMARNFQLAVDILGKPGKRDVKAYLSEMAVPAEGKADLLKIPAFIINGMFFLNRIQRALFPRSPYDTPFLPYNLRAGHKFLSEYDPDFSRATLDGDLSRDFYPEDALERVKCPMLLIWAGGHRHETWGLLGAMDDKDVACVTALVEDLHCVQIPGAHEIHMVQPGKYIDEVLKFVHTLRAGRKLP